MGETKLTFKRYEMKYLLDRQRYEALRERLDAYITPDTYFKSTVCSLYYDSDDYRLIRHSLDKPVYKEKLRVRSYGTPKADDTVFVELKKKYKGIIYKRRVPMSARQAEDYLAGKAPAAEDSQMVREIDWFLKTNNVAPRVLISCDREAYVAKEDRELRITFDSNLCWRETELELTEGCYGDMLLADGQVLMETKIPGAAPLWLSRMFSELEIFPTSFSKYGNCYKNMILNGVIYSA